MSAWLLPCKTLDEAQEASSEASERIKVITNWGWWQREANKVELWEIPLTEAKPIQEEVVQK